MEDLIVGLCLLCLATVIALVAWLAKREIRRFDKVPQRLMRTMIRQARDDKRLSVIEKKLGIVPTIFPIDEYPDDLMTEDSA